MLIFFQVSFFMSPYMVLLCFVKGHWGHFSMKARRKDTLLHRCGTVVCLITKPVAANVHPHLTALNLTTF